MKHVLTAGLIAAFSTEARAFEIETPVSESCHEDLTLEAARASGFPVFADAPSATDEQKRAMADLVFTLPEPDPWTLALLIGVRSNDLGANAPTDLEALVHIHDDPTEQDAHCMRRQEDDGAAGDIGALEACRAFILGELETGGLLDDTLVLSSLEQVSSFYRFRGTYEVGLSRAVYRLGRATHAVQDAYTHSMRDADTGAVRHVLNWVDAFGDNEYVEASDGYQHLSGLDDCRRTDTHQRLRIDRATEATKQLFIAIADPASGRRARVTAAVDAALVLMPGCDASNRYCNAPELAESKDIRSFGCSSTRSDGRVLLGLAIVLIGWRRRRRYRSQGSELYAPTALLVSILALGGAPLVATAQPAPTAPTQPATGPAQPTQPTQPTAPTQPGPVPTAPPPPPVTDLPPAPATAAERPSTLGVDPEGADDDPSAVSPVDWHTDHWHINARVGGSIDDAGAGGMIGIGKSLGRWDLGVIAEWNPWFSYDRVSVRPGVFNAYATVGHRWFRGNRLTIATRAEVGSSTMLFELLGVDRFTTGVYLGGAMAEIRYPVSRFITLTFDPIHFAMPIPRPFGLPFYYKQYRVTFGVEMRL